MNTKALILLSSIIALLLLVIGVNRIFFTPSSTSQSTSTATSTSQAQLGADPKNATYRIEGSLVTLVNGVSIATSAPGSATHVTTRYFGNEVVHDLNGDGRPDTAFILTQDTGSSGTFYYAVAALNTLSGYVGSQGLLLGDRIAPQATTMGTGTIVIFTYAERKPGESFATPPSVGKSMWLKLDPTTMQFGEVAQNFEGEADPARMTLGMKTWNWVDTIYNNDTTSKPRIANRFTLTFKSGGTFSATTDCNSVGGTYTTTGTSITFSKMASTLMYCQGSQEGDFTKMLSEAKSYHFTSKGELVFDLQQDSGTFVFK
jgi:heat shock protein HslJ